MARSKSTTKVYAVKMTNKDGFPLRDRHVSAQTFKGAVTAARGVVINTRKQKKDPGVVLAGVDLMLSLDAE